jgi:hypothetical protein
MTEGDRGLQVRTKPNCRLRLSSMLRILSAVLRPEVLRAGLTLLPEHCG